jgi:O-antigen/teichoic acid export membrane protein
MVAISPDESQRLQQDVFITDLIEDIALQATLQLPVIQVTPEKETLSQQRQVLARTAGSAAIAGIGDFTFAVLKYAINVAMTNLVSESIYGTYVAAYTSVSIVGSMAVVGLDSTILRFLSMYRAKDERNLATGLIRFVTLMTLVSGMLCCAFFFLSAAALSHLIYHQDAYTLPLKEIALLIPMISLQLVFSSGLQALKAIKWKVLVDRLIQPLVCLVLILIFYRLGLRLDALILATMCGFLASVITGRVLLRKASQHVVQDATPQFEKKVWLRFALPMSLNSFIQSVMNSADVLFLTIFASAAQVGLYAAADRASTFVMMPLLALNTIFSPLIAEYYAVGEHKQIASLFRVVTKWSFSLSLPVFLCFVVFHEAILGIFTKGYTAAGVALIILSLGNLINAGTGLTGSLLLMTGQTRALLANTAVSIAFNAGLAFLLVPHFNVIGAAIAAASAVVALDLISLIEVLCILKIFPLHWDLMKPVAAGGIASIVGLVLLRFVHVGYGYKAIFGALALVLPFMLVYLVVLAALGFSNEDMFVFDAVRAKFSKKPAA